LDSLPPSTGEVTIVVRGEESIAGLVLQVLANTKQKFASCGDSLAPSIAMGSPLYKRTISELAARGVNYRYLTEITKENLAFCKELQKYVELRHLDGVKINFGLNERECIAATIVHEGPMPLSQVTYSSMKSIIEQQQYLFETLWDRATPAEQRIREIEEGIERPGTMVLSNLQEIAAARKKLIENSDELLVCSRVEGLGMIGSHFLESYKAVLSKHRQGKHKGIRWITSISRKDATLVKAFLDMGVQIRHMPALPIMNFAVTNSGFEESISAMEGGSLADRMLQSNERIYLEYYRQAFERLWSQATDAADVIRDIEKGVEQSGIEVIRNPREALRRAWEMIRSARAEVSLLFSTANAFRRQAQSGGTDVIRAALQNSVRVRILIPADESIEQMQTQTKTLLPQANIRSIDKSLETRLTVVIVDEIESMVFELKDDSATGSQDAVGVATYSASKTIASSYNAIFESLWKQSELYEQVQMHDRMQKEFVNIAAHELRTPIQPILSTIDLLKSKLEGKAVAEITAKQLEIMDRNARRLQKLSSEILDATRIEAGTLRLDMEVMDINDKVRSVIADAKSMIPQGQSIDIQFKPAAEESGRPIPLLVKADRLRIFEVISNLVRNAIKFSAGEESSVITITTDKSNDHRGGDCYAIVSVKDCGAGISAEVLPRLFTKFSTDRERGGTGLGLFIAKNIVEAHGGRIWAENNKDNKDGERGATFSFTLPLAGQ
jgi:two-component system sensor histidine kinase VicK